MDFLFPLHQYLVKHYDEVESEVEHMSTDSSRESLSTFLMWLGKLSRKSPEGSIAHKPEVARMRQGILGGLLVHSKAFPANSRLSGMLDVECPLDEAAFRSFLGIQLCLAYRYLLPESLDAFRLKKHERLLAKLSESNVTFRREEHFPLPRTTEIVAEYCAPLDSTFEPGTVGNIVLRLRGIRYKAFEILLAVTDQPEMWTHHAPSAKRRAFQEAQEAAHKAATSLSPDMLAFLQENPQVWYQALDNLQVPAS
jgi:hypothetical protein